VAFGGGCAAATGHCPAGTVWISDNGQDWARVADFPYGHAVNGFSAAGFGPTGWVAFADGGVAWFSADGRRWTVAEAPLDPLADGGPTYTADEDVCCEGTVRAVAETAGTYVAVGAVTCRKCLGRAAIWRSEDGETWERVPYESAFEGAPLSGVVALPSGRLVAVGGSYALVSDGKGVTWIAEPAFGAGTASVLAFVGDHLLAAGFPGGAYEGAYWQSSDGVTWESVAIGIPFPEAIPIAITSIGGSVIISGKARRPEESMDWGFTAISSDLATWRPIATSDGRPFLMWSFAEVDGNMVAGGNFSGEAEYLPAGVWILR